MTATQPGRIPCPACSQPLALPIEAVLTGQAIACAGCGLELTAQRETSHEALNALGRWYEETAEARTTAASGQASAAAGQTAKASRRVTRPRR
ncbi:hypothetical protein HBA54_07100 [Pelagibius litoralis]|uniref:Uncharacterized protein n=1 Tax=Pelagibius litoralis TaxID=374515 RepID=A0A967C4P3_9PROT|nr:hypothetical protein [Pelagibius litoralis]NIA68355.1 hypothetical protein [Pelagibius litoralis]